MLFLFILYDRFLRNVVNGGLLGILVVFILGFLVVFGVVGRVVLFFVVRSLFFVEILLYDFFGYEVFIGKIKIK